MNRNPTTKRTTRIKSTFAATIGDAAGHLPRKQSNKYDDLPKSTAGEEARRQRQMDAKDNRCRRCGTRSDAGGFTVGGWHCNGCFAASAQSAEAR